MRSHQYDPTDTTDPERSCLDPDRHHFYKKDQFLHQTNSWARNLLHLVTIQFLLFRFFNVVQITCEEGVGCQACLQYKRGIVRVWFFCTVII
jgi:hypothetical protein